MQSHKTTKSYKCVFALTVMSSLRLLPLKSKCVSELEMLWFSDNECDIWFTPFDVRPQWASASLQRPFETLAMGPARWIAPKEKIHYKGCIFRELNCWAAKEAERTFIYGTMQHAIWYIQVYIKHNKVHIGRKQHLIIDIYKYLRKLHTQRLCLYTGSTNKNDVMLK